jgi:hypothetical protein
MRVLLVLLLGLVSGCVPFAYALPPSHLEAGAAYRNVTPAQRGEPDPVFHMSYTVTPLSVKPEWQARPVDVGPSFVLDAGRAGTTVGGGLTMMGFLYDQPEGDGHWRLGVLGQGRLLWNSAQNQLGQGAAVQGFAEYSSWVDGPYESSDGNGALWGQSYGEGGIGAYVEGSYSRIGTVNTWTAGGGLLFRIPATAGVGLIWAWAFL